VRRSLLEPDKKNRIRNQAIEREDRTATQTQRSNDTTGVRWKHFLDAGVMGSACVYGDV